MIPFALLAVLTLADIGTTVFALLHGATEANPILNPLFKRLGAIPTLVTVKLGFLALAWFAQDEVIFGFNVLVLLCVGYVVVVVNNLIQIRKQLKFNKEARNG